MSLSTSNVNDTPGGLRHLVSEQNLGAKALATQVLIVHSDLATRDLLSFLLPTNGLVAKTISDSRAVAPFLRAEPVDLVLLDVALPCIDGFTLCAAIRQEHPNIPIIFVTERDALRDKVTGFTRGADDYISKPFESGELLARIWAVLRRYGRVEHERSGTVITVGDASLDLGRMQFYAQTHRPILLTPTEMRLLKHLMCNANTVVTRTSLIEHTHGDHSAEGSNRTDVYVRRLRKKIGGNPDDVAFIHTIRGVGYMFRGSRPQSESTG